MAVSEQTIISGKQLDTLCVNTIRTLSIDAVQKANSGHPGAPMGLAPVAYTLWQQFLKYDPEDPIWPNRDRFVLSAGHASMRIPNAKSGASSRHQLHQPASTFW